MKTPPAIEPAPCALGNRRADTRAASSVARSCIRIRPFVWRSALLGLALAALPSCADFKPPPSDADLLAAFPTRKPLLEDMVAMLKADGLDVEHFRALAQPVEDAVRETKLSPGRVEEYRKKMAQAGVVMIAYDRAQREMPFNVAFFCGRYARHRAGKNKGYIFLPTTPMEANRIVVLPSLDRMDGTTQYIAYRHVEGKWYLHYNGGD